MRIIYIYQLYKYCKILEALSNNNFEDLNKNLKTKAMTKLYIY